MPKKYFSIERIKKAISHLQVYDSNWVIVPLVFAVNGVNSNSTTNLKEKNGTDVFLDNYFSGRLIGLKPFNNNVNTMRPRFSDVYGNMKNSGRAGDYIIHQATKLWANVYSSRGYREMTTSGAVICPRPSNFQLSKQFVTTWSKKLQKTFHYEELLVWLYAFSGIDQAYNTWDEIDNDFQTRWLGTGKKFEKEFQAHFHLNAVSWKPSDFVTARPADEDFQKELCPSEFSQNGNEPADVQNKIVYGPPGVGKSFSIDQEIQATEGASRYITTFHPEYTHADFVGGFRPATEKVGKGPPIISYKFRPEVFMNAYVDAWKNPGTSVFLVIEEMNRGNAASIFGDIFQLLDRDKDGYSQYEISCSEEIQRFLSDELKGSDYVNRVKSVHESKFGGQLVNPFSVLILPKNLMIRATINTSDQSLFPMDSAFKRRWSWKYTPIQYEYVDRVIQIGTNNFSWNDFVKRVNDKIYEILEVEDKCIGVYFIKSELITAEEFRDKVIFYLWNDILRDELPETKLRIFPAKKDDHGKESSFPVNFNDFFDKQGGWAYVLDLLSKLGLNPTL